MLNRLSFNNYKSFASGTLEIKPITILLGANSVGKSSLMQLLLMLQQTANTDRSYQSALKLHGEHVSLGEGINLLRGKDTKKSIQFEIEFDSKDLRESLTLLRRDFCVQVLSFPQLMYRMFNYEEVKGRSIISRLKKLITNNDEFLSGFHMRHDDLEELFLQKSFSKRLQEIKIFAEEMQKQGVLTEERRKEFSRLPYFYMEKSGFGRQGGLSLYESILNSQEELEICYDFLTKTLNSLTSDTYKIKYELSYIDKLFYFKNIVIFNGDEELIKVGFDMRSKGGYSPNSIKSKHIDEEIFKKYSYESVKRNFRNPSPLFAFIDKNHKSDSSVFSDILCSFLNDLCSSCGEMFTNRDINYVSPLRAHPKRYYFLDNAKGNAFLDTLNGDEVAEILKENEKLTSKVNGWFEKFDLKVNVEHLEDVIHKLQVTQNSLDLDITDVGFGVSQVLPVIIQGFLSPKNSLTLIEQPEIHLHPQMQAELADLFIDITDIDKDEASKYLLIETHSEYLLKRLRRRIAEGKISASDIAIHSISPQEGQTGANISMLEIESKGSFDWPKDFYGGELMRDTTEFLRNQ